MPPMPTRPPPVVPPEEMPEEAHQIATKLADLELRIAQLRREEHNLRLDAKATSAEAMTPEERVASLDAIADVERRALEADREAIDLVGLVLALRASVLAPHLRPSEEVAHASA